MVSIVDKLFILAQCHHSAEEGQCEKEVTHDNGTFPEQEKEKTDLP